MIRLPIDEFIPGILESLKEHKNLVLVAEPGAGKTTRVPPALLEDAAAGEILVLQPRRIAARAAAARIAEESGWSVGQEVGYQIRFENRTGPKTRIRIVTEGILNRRLQHDPELKGVSHVVLDEFHERSLHTDLAVSLLREAQQSLRDDLHIIVMSATLDAEPVARFLDDCPVLNIPGRTFPVEVVHSGKSLPFQTGPEFISNVTAEVRKAVLSPERMPGHVLVFLPGAGEIRRCEETLENLPGEFAVVPLHGTLSIDEQDAALKPSAKTKIILATNIAETSLTIDGVRTVIDSGFARTLRFDANTGLEKLQLGRISRASATQRAGRAGRQAPGRAIRLWSTHDESSFADFELPEIRRADLCETVLMLAQWGVSDPDSFGWFERPPEATVARSRQLLMRLGALEKSGQITDLGNALLNYPLHPRLARLLQSAVDEGKFLQEAALAAALLSERDPVQRDYLARNSSGAESDVLMRLELVMNGEGVSRGTARGLQRVKDQLVQIAQKAKRIGKPKGISDADEFIERALMLAYPDRICRRRRPGSPEARMVGGKGLELGPQSSVKKSEFFVCLETREQERSGTKKIVSDVASRIELEWIKEDFPLSIKEKKSVEMHPGSGKVASFATLYFEDLPLEEPRPSEVSAEAAGPLLVEAVCSQWERLTREQSDLSQWLARLEFLRVNMPELEWPEISEEKIRDAAEMACMGENSLKRILEKPMAVYLDGMLNGRQRSALAKEAPKAIEVPSGRELPIQYSQEQGAVLEVRLQELFGWLDSPKLAGGRVPLTLALLGPNFRPVQVTRDLKSFWAKGYQEVRKELRARYPKHSWPEDPYTAKPEAKGSRRR